MENGFYEVKVDSSNDEFKNSIIDEDEYYKHLSDYKKICRGCINEHSNMCGEGAVIKCYLLSLLPKGMLATAMLHDGTKNVLKKLLVI